MFKNDSLFEPCIYKLKNNTNYKKNYKKEEQRDGCKK